MNTPLNAPQPAASANKPLWTAVIVLGVAVIGMAAALIRFQSKPEVPQVPVVTSAAPAPLLAASIAPVAQIAPAAITPPAPVQALPDETPLPAKHTHKETPVKQAHTVPKNTASHKPAVKPAPVVEQATQTYETPPPVVQVVKPICNSCGTVQSVTPIQRDGVGGGGGALAGGVLGAVVGNQIGGGEGKNLATILGAIGGGLAGNAVEKKMKKETVYQVQVRMDDGSVRTLEQATPATIGRTVVVDGNNLQPF